MKDYYEILGISPNAEIVVINAAYRALVQIYHPDKWKGDKKLGEQKIRDINEAYETLKNKDKRKKYDDEYSASKSENYDFDKDNFKDEYNVYEKIIVNSWKFAKEYYPEITNYYEELKKINKNLAWQFQVICVEDKCFSDSKNIYSILKNDFLTRYFGNNKELKELALEAILKGNRQIAKEINKAINILGDNAAKEIKAKILKKYSSFHGPKRENNSSKNEEIFSYKGFRVKKDNYKNFYKIVATTAFGRRHLDETFRTIDEFKNYIDKL